VSCADSPSADPLPYRWLSVEAGTQPSGTRLRPPAAPDSHSGGSSPSNRLAADSPVSSSTCTYRAGGCATRPGRAGASPPSGSYRCRSATRRACTAPDRRSARTGSLRQPRGPSPGPRSACPGRARRHHETSPGDHGRAGGRRPPPALIVASPQPALRASALHRYVAHLTAEVGAHRHR